MAIYVNTSSPSELLKKVKEQINNGKIVTWLVDDDGDFTYNVDQWRYKAWLRPTIVSNKLIMGMLCRNDKNISITEYAIYHGRFVEMLLQHFDNKFIDIISTAMPTGYDTVSSNIKK